MPVQRNRPALTADSSAAATPNRTGGYGEAGIVPYGTGRASLADEGSYFVAQNATVGTQLTAHVAPAIADTNTKSIIHFFNPTGGKYICLDYLVLTTVVANASATAVDFLAYTDSKLATGLTSGGTAITSISNTRSDSIATSSITLTAGACVTAPVTNIHRVLQRTVKPYIGVALDSYSFVFGNGAYAPSGFALITAVTHTLTSCAPVIIAPGGNFYFVQTGPSGASTAMTFEFEMGWWER